LDFFKSFTFLGALILLSLVIIPFVVNFWGYGFSNQMLDWANFGVYFSGILTPVAGLAIFWQLWNQQKLVALGNEAQLKDQNYREVESLIDDINDVIIAYDARFHKNDLLGLRLLKEALLSPLDWGNVVFVNSNDLNDSFEKNYIFSKISKKLIRLQLLARKINDQSLYEKLESDFEGITFVFSAKKWLPDRFQFAN
jgi:hypothetical protein